MMGKILERYEMNGTIIELVKAAHGYDIIYISGNTIGYFVKNVPLAEAYAHIAGYMYARVKLMEARNS